MTLNTAQHWLLIRNRQQNSVHSVQRVTRSGHQPHPHPISIGCNPILMKFIPIPIKSAVLYISTDNLTVYRRRKN